MSSAAIVTTLKNQGASLLTFVEYHLAIGFSKIYLMFDDPEDPDQHLVSRIPGVEVSLCDDQIREKWKTLHKYQKYGAHIDMEVRARQTLNAELAMQYALSDGMNWLLHIDSDELFWISDSTIHPHLDRLGEIGLVSVKYHNFEAIPEKENIENCFLEVNTFKKPSKLLTKQGIDRNNLWPSNRKYFNFYSNGKSMCQVREDMVPGDVHKWSSKTEHIFTSSFYHPAILHYSCCGYQNFENKFKKLIDNGSTGVEFGVAIKDNGFTLDHDAITAFRQGDESAARDIYRNRVMLPPEEIKFFEERGLIERCHIGSRIESVLPTSSQPSLKH
ncbi:MAG: glycosyltransferase family 2 protein [Acidiferrobacterales bacterium]|nr:glycosyltransferase family 2 protein [Acidiferrobacterales bacterium]